MIGYCSRRPPAAALALVAALSAAFMGGCGFRPLYGTAPDRDVLSHFAAIDVRPIPHRRGQQLRNELLDRLTPRGRPGRPVYALVVRLSERTQELAVARDALATRANLRLSVRFTLTNSSSGETLLSGQTMTISSYNLLDSEFATLSAENDARARAVQQLAEDIRTRLGVYFVDRSPPIAARG